MRDSSINIGSVIQEESRMRTSIASMENLRFASNSNRGAAAFSGDSSNTEALRDPVSASERQAAVACSPSVTMPPIEESLSVDLSGPLESVLNPGTSTSRMLHPVDRERLGHQIIKIFSESTDPRAALKRLACVLADAFQVECCALTVATGCLAGGETFFGVCDRVLSADSSYPTQIPTQVLTADALARVLSRTHVQAVDDLQLEPVADPVYPLAPPDLLLPQVRAVLASTVQFQGQANGAIDLMRSQPYSWTEAEKDLLRWISAQVAIAISQYQLQQQAKRQAQYQSLVSQLTMTIRHSLDLDRILELATRGTAQTLGADRGLLLLLKYSDPLLKSRSLSRTKVTVVCEWPPQRDREKKEGTQNSPDLHPTLPTLLDRSLFIADCILCQQAFDRSPQPLIAANLPAKSNPFNEHSPSTFSLEVLPALLLIPLESQGTVLGFLALQCQPNRAWQPEELEFAELIGAQLSTAIIQTQTLRRVQALVDERTAQLQRSLEVQAKLYEKTRQQIDQLRNLNQLKDEFLSTMSHELRTPLTSMTLAMRMLRESGPLEANQVKYLNILEQQCTQEIDLINDLLALQKLESKQAPIHLQKIQLNPFIQDLIEPFERKWADKGLILAVDLPERSPMLQTDVDSLNRIVTELLTNAGKYSAPDTTVSLSAKRNLDLQPNQIVLALANLGTGISQSDLSCIFEKFRRGQGVTQQAVQGTGLGLALVKSLVQHLNGKIEVSSQMLEGTQTCETCFTLTLPQSLDVDSP